jgi:hypothetical protein
MLQKVQPIINENTSLKNKIETLISENKRLKNNCEEWETAK